MSTKKEKPKPINEPIERFQHRLACKNLGYSGNCYKRSGWTSIGGGACHLSLGCNGECRRMKIWDTQHGFKGVEFKLRGML